MWTRRAASGAFAGAFAAPFMTGPAAGAPHYDLVAFESSPFPYDGKIPDTGAPFLDAQQNGQRGHTSPRGGVYLEDPTYSDRRVLLALSPHFRSENASLVVFLHGNLARLERDIEGRQRIVAQVLASRRNVALVAPQFAVDALDSSAGHFWDEGGFAKFLDEAAYRLAARSRHPREVFARLPVVLVAYSGGYNPAAAILSRGGAGERIAGVILMDALYGEEETFAAWRVGAWRRTFFFSAYSLSSAAGNVSLQSTLATHGVPLVQGLPARLTPGTSAFLETGPVVHNDFMTRAWVDDPLRLVLSRMVF